MTVTVELNEKDKSKIVIDAPFRFKDLIKSLPGSKFSPSSNHWTVPVSWQMCIALRTTFKDTLTIGPELATWATKWRTERVEPGYAMRNQLDAPGDPALYPHQRAGAKFLANQKRAILADGLGSGKTRTVLSGLKELESNGEDPFPVLVVCPNSTKLGWAREIKEIFPDKVVSVITGSAVQRRKALKVEADFYVINWESVRSHSRIAPYGSNAIKKCVACGGKDPKVKETQCQAHLKELNEMFFGAIIADEAHRMKSGSALATRALKAATGDAEFRFALTGTPIANAPDDLWSILNWLYPEAYPSKVKYIDRYLDVAYNVWGQPTVIGVRQGMEREFFAGIDPILRRMPKEVVLPFLPPIVYERRDVEMSPKQAKAYKQMRDQMLADIDGELLVNTNPMTKMTRLLQLASAFMEVETHTEVDPKTGDDKLVQKVTLTEPSSKLDAFIDDIESFGDESVIVFHPYKQVINMLSKRLDKLEVRHGRITGDEDEIERQFHMDQFQSGKTKFILCTTGAGGTGITLTKASIAAYLGRPWSAIDSEQSEGRNHRLGSEIHDKIIYRDYVCLNTVEEAVFQALTLKSELLQTILRDKDLMRKVIEDGKLDEDDIKK